MSTAMASTPWSRMSGARRASGAALLAELHAAADGEQHRLEVALRPHRAPIRGLVLGAGREDHVVSRHERARRELGVEEIQARHVEVFPQIDEHEVEGAG